MEHCKKKIQYLIYVLMVFGLVLGLTGTASADLVGWWRLDDGSGTTAIDSSDNGNDGTLMGNPKWVAGKVDGALECDGGDYVDVPGAADLNPQNITLMTWVNFNTVDTAAMERQDFLSRGDDYSLTLHEWVGDGKIHGVVTSAGEWSVVPGSTVVEADTWYHLALTYDTTTQNLTLYLNGEVEGQLSVPAGLEHRLGGSLTIGTYDGRDLLGKIDDVKIFDHAMSQSEIIESLSAPTGVPGEVFEPRANLEPEFMETFDDPDPGWDFSSGATVANGILRLNKEGAKASYNSDWYNYTTVVRMRCTNPGVIGFNFISAGGDIIHLVLGAESLKAHRVLPSHAVNMIVERHIPGSPKLPVNKWFTLQILQFDGMFIVGVDGERMCILYNPTPGLLPPNGFSFAAKGNTTVEIDTVTVVPWMIERFGEALSSAWEVSDEDIRHNIEEDKLIIPPGGRAVRLGHWEEMTFHTRLRRDRLIHAVLTYPGHVLTLTEDRITLSAPSGRGLSELAGAPLPKFPEGPENAIWMDVTVVIRDGRHHVLVYSTELFSVRSEVIAGTVSAEAIEGILELERLLIGWPLPLWPTAGTPGEPGGSEPGGGEPGTGQPSIPWADLAVTDLFPDQVPTGTLYLRITNYGPDTIDGVPVTVTCGGTATDVTSRAVITIPEAPQGTFNITLMPRQTLVFPTKIDLDLNNYDYDLRCRISAFDSTAFVDSDPGNDTYTEQIAAIPPDAPLADLSVTDIYSDPIEPSSIGVRITNNGPDAVQNVAVIMTLDGIEHRNSGNDYVLSVEYSFDVTLELGETYDKMIFPGGKTIDNWFEITCEIVSPLDSNPNNNRYSKTIGSPPQDEMIEADLAVTDIFPESLPQGDVYCRITNHGPDALQNTTVQLNTAAIAHYELVGIHGGYNSTNSISLTLQPDETGEFDTGFAVDLNFYEWCEIICEITSSLFDPVTSNNSYSEIIGSSSQAQIIQADLAVTDIFPDSMPQGDVYCRITNHGPDPMKDVTISLQTEVTKHSRTLGDPPSWFILFDEITTSLEDGQTKPFLILSGIDTSKYWYEIKCQVEHLPLLDPKSDNNSFSEIITTSP